MDGHTARWDRVVSEGRSSTWMRNRGADYLSRDVPKLSGAGRAFWKPSLRGHCMSPPASAATSQGRDAGVEAHLPRWGSSSGLISISGV